MVFTWLFRQTSRPFLRAKALCKSAPNFFAQCIRGGRAWGMLRLELVHDGPVATVQFLGLHKGGRTRLFELLCSRHTELHGLLEAGTQKKNGTEERQAEGHIKKL